MNPSAMDRASSRVITWGLATITLIDAAVLFSQAYGFQFYILLAIIKAITGVCLLTDTRAAGIWATLISGIHLLFAVLVSLMLAGAFGATTAEVLLFHSPGIILIGLLIMYTVARNRLQENILSSFLPLSLVMVVLGV